MAGGLIQSAQDEAPSGGSESTGVKSVGSGVDEVKSKAAGKTGYGLTETNCSFGNGPGKSPTPVK